MPIEVKITGADELSRLHRRLRDAGRGDLRKELNRRLRQEARPIVDDLKRTVRGLPVKGSRGGGRKQRAEHTLSRRKKVTEKTRERAHRTAGLRETIARAIGIKIKLSGITTGVRIRVDGTRLPQDQRRLPRHMDKGHWRHPVFGNRDVWVDQYARPWWFVTIRPHLPKVRQGMLDVMRDIANKITS